MLKVQPAICLDDVSVTGIKEVTLDAMNEAKSNGNAIRLVASATLKKTSKYEYKVEPIETPINSFVGGTINGEMCCVFESDLFDNLFIKSDEYDVVPTSGAVLRDIINSV